MINRIVIDNFKSIRHLDLELRPLNVLIGANGSGKSNLIDFFRLWVNLQKGYLDAYTRNEGGSNQILHYGFENSKFLGGQIFLSNEKSYTFRLSPDKQDNFYYETERLEYSKNGELKVKEVRDRKDSLLSGGEFSEYEPHIYHLLYTGKLGPLRQPASIHANAYLKENGGNLPSFLYFIKSTHPKKFKFIEATVKSVSPFFKEFVLEPDPFNDQFIRLQWRGRDEPFPFDASHFSDGTLRFIALTTLLMQPDPPKLIVIDEPELGLHPFAIEKLAALIRTASKHTQVIIATQSPALVSNFQPEDIITVDWKDGQSTFQRHTTEELAVWLEDYSLGEIWDKNIIGGQP